MTNPLRTAPRRAGFTLIELLVVIGIVDILAPVSVPIIASVRANADSARSLANLRQIGIALNSYAADKGYFPPVDGESQFEGVDSWVGEVLLTLNPSASVEELNEALPTSVFVSPSLAWEDGGGGGSFYEESELINTYAVTDTLVGLDGDFRSDRTIGRRPDSIERRPESIMVVEAEQNGSNPSSIDYISWGEAKQDLSTDTPEETSTVDFRYRNRLNVMMADMSAKTLRPEDTAKIEKENWSGFDYRDRR